MITAAEWTAIGGVVVSAAGVVVGIWKYATHLNDKRELDKDKRHDSILDANEHLRLELYEQNKQLRAENKEQYEIAKRLSTERDILEDELRRQYRYIDWVRFELTRTCPAAMEIMERLPDPPKRLLLDEKNV